MPNITNKPKPVNNDAIARQPNEIDKTEEGLKNIEKRFAHWPLPECPTKTGIDFQIYLGNPLPMPNPYQTGAATITVYTRKTATGNLIPVPTLAIQSRSINARNFIGLRCDYRTDIDFRDEFKTVNLYYFDGGGKIEIVLANGKTDEKTVPNVYQPTLISLGNYGIPIKQISLLGVNEMFLLAFCADTESKQDDHD